jgi:nucleoside-diphosphate kinase
MKERTLYLIKPDGVKRSLIGELIKRVEEKGLKILTLKMIQVDEKLAREHYAEHCKKPFFHDLVRHIRSGPCVAMILEGENAISSLRSLVGETDPSKAKKGTIRGDLAKDILQNLAHASDSRESAEREIKLFFGDGWDNKNRGE